MKCSSCNKNKSLSSFKNRKSGRIDKICKKCMKLYLFEYKRLKPEKYLLWNIRLRAKKNNIPFNLTENDLIVPKNCPVLGIPLFVSNERKNSIISDNSPTVDRINPKLGYIKSNIAVISWRANRLKGTGTAEEHRKIAHYLSSSIRGLL